MAINMTKITVPKNANTKFPIDYTGRDSAVSPQVCAIIYNYFLNLK